MAIGLLWDKAPVIPGGGVSADDIIYCIEISYEYVQVAHLAYTFTYTYAMACPGTS